MNHPSALADSMHFNRFALRASLVGMIFAVGPRTASSATLKGYDIVPLFQVLAPGKAGLPGISGIHVDRVLTSSDTVGFTASWGSNGHVYVSANYEIFNGMKPAPEDM